MKGMLSERCSLFIARESNFYYHSISVCYPYIGKYLTKGKLSQKCSSNFCESRGSLSFLCCVLPRHPLWLSLSTAETRIHWTQECCQKCTLDYCSSHLWNRVGELSKNRAAHKRQSLFQWDKCRSLKQYWELPKIKFSYKCVIKHFFQAQVRNSEKTFNQCNWLQIKGKAAKVEQAAAVNLWEGNEMMPIGYCILHKSYL